jgi:hypothetical protein
MTRLLVFILLLFTSPALAFQGMGPGPGVGRTYSGGGGGDNPGWTYFAAASNYDSAASQTTITASVSDIPSGALVVVFVDSLTEGATISSVSDGSATLTSTTGISGTDHTGQLWYQLASSGGTKTFTATFSAAVAYPGISVQVIAYSGQISYIDSAMGLGNSAAITTGPVTTSGSYPITLFHGSTADPRVKSSVTIGGNTVSNLVQGDFSFEGWYAGAISSGSGSASIPQSVSWVAGIISFKEQ